MLLTGEKMLRYSKMLQAARLRAGWSTVARGGCSEC